jgi:ABC-type uncharacterized transport system auxiliary subunit
VKTGKRKSDMRNIFIVLLALAASAACTMPETRIYSLHLSAQKSPAPQTEASVVVRVDAPRYLEEPYMARRDSPYQVQIARYSKWDEAPSALVGEAVKSTLRSSGYFREIRVSRIVPKGYYDLAIDLRKFERFDEGEQSLGHLAFNADLTSPDGALLFRGSFEKSVKLSEKSFIALAKALSTAMTEVLSELGTNVERSLKQPPGR